MSPMGNPPSGGGAAGGLPMPGLGGQGGGAGAAGGLPMPGLGGQQQQAPLGQQ